MNANNSLSEEVSTMIDAAVELNPWEAKISFEWDGTMAAVIVDRGDGYAPVFDDWAFDAFMGRSFGFWDPDAYQVAARLFLLAMQWAQPASDSLLSRELWVCQSETAAA